MVCEVDFAFERFGVKFSFAPKPQGGLARVVGRLNHFYREDIDVFFKLYLGKEE